MTTVRRALLCSALVAGLGATPAVSAPRRCPLVSDAAGDVVPGLVVADLGDEKGLDIVAVDVSSGPVRTSTTVWLTELDGTLPVSGAGDFYDVYFRIGRATLWTHAFHWVANDSFDAGWIDEDGTKHYFSAGRGAGSYDPELGMVRVSFDNVLLEADPIEGEPRIRNGTVITGIAAEARRVTQDGDPADVATSTATYRVGQGSCPPYRLALRT